MKLLRGICSKSHFDLILKLQSCSKFEHEILELIKDISLFNTSFRKFNVIPYHVLFHQISILSCQVKWSQTSAKLQPDNWIFSQFGLVGWILLDIYSQTLPAVDPFGKCVHLCSGGRTCQEEGATKSEVPMHDGSLRCFQSIPGGWGSAGRENTCFVRDKFLTDG